MGTHRKSHEGALKKTLAAGAIAGAAVGFGALAAAPMASADESGNEGWWLGSGNANNNNTIFGQMGSGNANQIGNFNGNIQNKQFNVLSPVIGGTATQVNVPINTNTPIAANVPVVTGNNAGTGTTLGVNPALATPIGLGAGLGGSPVGLNGGAAIPVNAGAAIPIQIPIQVPLAVPGDNINAGVGAVQTGDTTGAIVDDSGDQAGDGIGNVQVAGAESGDVKGGNNSATTNVGGSAGNGTTIINRNTAINTATAAGNIAHNSSNNNTNTGSGTNSPNSVGNSTTNNTTNNNGGD